MDSENTKDSNDKTSTEDKKKIIEKDLYSWKAPARPFKRRNREFWVTIIAVAVIFGLVLFLAEGPMPVLMIVSLVFLFYVLSTVEPEEIEYKITNKGVKIVDKRTDWNILTRFWYTHRFNHDILVFEKITLPGRLELVVHASDKEPLRKVLKEYLPEEEAPPSNIDKAANWFTKKLPGNS